MVRNLKNKSEPSPRFPS